MKLNSSALAPITIIIIIILAIVAYLSADKPSSDFSRYAAGQERKDAFVAYFLPIIQQQNRKILLARGHLDRLASHNKLSLVDRNWLMRTAATYKLEPEDPNLLEKLLTHVDIISPSLALAQSANESAWGTSRFAKKGNNYFGQWCFKAGCGIVPKHRPKGSTHEVQAFDSPSQSVASYMENINTNNAYKHLRKIRKELRDSGKNVTGTLLANGLGKYSERGIEYITEIKAMIRHNNFAKLDN